MADAMVLATQQWLNQTYGHLSGRFNTVDEDGITGWNTIYALTRALQIELGIQNTADSFGPTTKSLFQTMSKSNGTSNQYAILQGAFWCKGYSPGHYGFLDNHFDNPVEAAVISFKTDAGLASPNGDVTVDVMKALLNMDAFTLVSKGNPNIRQVQQYLNRNYQNYTGLNACDGVYGRATNTALIKGMQIEEGYTGSNVDGLIGDGTKALIPVLPDGAGLAPGVIVRFITLYKMAMSCNGFHIDTNWSTWNADTSLLTSQFQTHYALPVTGIGDVYTWMSLLTSRGDRTRAAQACDCATILTQDKAVTLHNNGYEAVGRYLTITSKALTKGEIQIIFNNNLRVFPIYQWFEQFYVFLDNAACIVIA